LLAGAFVHALVQTHSTALAVVLVLAVVAMVAWALQLMQAAADRKEFSLMLAGCMVCSAAVGLATVMVITVTTPARIDSSSLALLQASLGELSEIDGL
jgi:hypothetical protein